MYAGGQFWYLVLRPWLKKISAPMLKKQQHAVMLQAMLPCNVVMLTNQLQNLTT